MSDSDGEKKHDGRSWWLELARRVLSAILTIFVLIFFVIEDLFLFWLRPLFWMLGSLAPFIRFGAWLKTLPSYAALVMFAVPFILLEPPKILSLFLIGTGHFISGVTMLILSYILSIFIVERLFHVTRDQLLSISWFAWGFGFVMKLRAWAFERLESSAIWQALRPLGRRISASVKSAAASLYGWLTRMTQQNR